MRSAIKPPEIVVVIRSAKVAPALRPKAFSAAVVITRAGTPNSRAQQ
jgi:hypothetical protein